MESTAELAQIQSLYAEAFSWYDPKRAVPTIHVSFYPYVGINHTIRIRNSQIYVRIGTVCSDMPLVSHKGLAYILVGKLLRKRIPKGAREVYSAYAKSEHAREKAVASKRARGRKVVTSSQGTVYDLDEMFDGLNRRYFDDTIEKPVLTWSARKTYRILGHHDSTHGHITISRSLDSLSVPRFVVEYIVYHEMLHIAHPTQHKNGRRYNHTPAFRRDEERFENFDEAELWIERNVRRLKRDAKRG